MKNEALETAAAITLAALLVFMSVRIYLSLPDGPPPPGHAPTYEVAQ